MIRSRSITIAITILILLLSVFPTLGTAEAQSPVVRAVLFYSPSCPHCKQVIEELLPVLDQQYGSQIQIFGVDTYTEAGSNLFYSYIDQFQIPPEMQGVPTLVVGDRYLVGSADIPDQFPGIIEEGLANGGIDWPNIPGLMELMAADLAENDPGADSPSAAEIHQLTLKDKFMADLAGNILSVIVLAGMLAAVGYAGLTLTRGESGPGWEIPVWLIPVLSVIGLGVAGYLAYVEVNQVEAICGPVGNCNTVQQSSYATLFGILPVGVLGVLGYIGILITWLLSLLGLPENYNQLAKLALWVLTLFGVLFSIYLTFLEPFVIGASCMWCLSSAVIMTILFLAATRLMTHQPSEAGS